MESHKTRRAQKLKKIYRRRQVELAMQAQQEAAKPLPEELSSPHRTIRNLKLLLIDYEQVVPQLVQNCESLEGEVKRLATQKRDVSLGAQFAIQEFNLIKTELAKLKPLKVGLDSGPKISKTTRADRKVKNKQDWRKTAYSKWYDAAKNGDPIKTADDIAVDIAQAHNVANRRYPRGASTVKNAIKGIKGMAISDGKSGKPSRM